LAEDAARRVNVFYGQLRAALALLADPGVIPRHRGDNPDQDFRPSGAAERRCKHNDCYGDESAHLCTSRPGRSSIPPEM
jgi:hypothetical protein